LKKYDSIKWGMIGCGSVTEVKSGPAFSKVSNSELFAVASRNHLKAEDYAGRHNIPRWHKTPGELIDDPDVNAIYIATPPDAHLTYAVQSVRAGKPVYIEKPMALSHRECEVILRESEKAGMPVFVAYYRRALPAFVRIKEIVDTGEIGELRMIRLNLTRPLMKVSSDQLPWRVIPEISGGGIFVDLASHQLDYLDFIAGPVSDITSIVMNQGRKYRAEDIVIANFILGGKIPCSANWCFSAHENSFEDTVEITGEKGAIRFSCFEYVPVTVTKDDGDYTFPSDKPAHVQQPLIDLVVKDLLGTGTSPSTGHTAARTSRVTDEILKEYYSGTKN
jgi:predicted dehydrogenase